jgi:hypothetical protein
MNEDLLCNYLLGFHDETTLEGFYFLVHLVGIGIGTLEVTTTVDVEGVL